MKTQKLKKKLASLMDSWENIPSSPHPSKSFPSDRKALLGDMRHRVYKRKSVSPFSHSI
jgi:hypothetical protein